MGLILLIGSLLIFINSSNPDLKINFFKTDLRHFNFNEKLTLTNHGKKLSTFQANGVDGLGTNLESSYRSWESWKHNLNIQYYRDPDYHLVFYSTGMEFSTLHPKSSVELSLGAEFGIGELTIYSFQDYGEIDYALGWSAFAQYTNHFVLGEKIWNFFVSPAIKSYPFKFRGKEEIEDENIQAKGSEISAGIGFKF